MMRTIKAIRVPSANTSSNFDLYTVTWFHIVLNMSHSWERFRLELALDVNHFLRYLDELGLDVPGLFRLLVGLTTMYGQAEQTICMWGKLLLENVLGYCLHAIHFLLGLTTTLG